MGTAPPNNATAANARGVLPMSQITGPLDNGPGPNSRNIGSMFKSRDYSSYQGDANDSHDHGQHEVSDALSRWDAHGQYEHVARHRC
jgi:hypothetical protein